MNSEKRGLISVIIPAKNEQGNIRILIKKIKSIKAKELADFDMEIIVVCSSKKDKTLKAAEKLRVHLLVEKGVPSRSNAIITGFKRARGDYFVTIDADLSQPPEEIPIFVRQLLTAKKNGMVAGSRNMGSSDDETLVRKMGVRVLTKIFNLLMKSSSTDVLYGLKVFKREIFDKSVFNSKSLGIDIELLANAKRSGLKVIEVPSYEKRRYKGEVKTKIIKHGFTNLWEILRQGLNYRFGINLPPL